MADITAAMVKDLREKTGVGMMDCKAALAATNGDLCFTSNDPIQAPGDPSLHPYRCCYDRLNLTPPAPQP